MCLCKRGRGTSIWSIRGAAGFGCFVSHRVSPSADGEIKSNPVFSGDMRLGKHSTQGKWGDNSEGIEPYFPCIPSKKSLDFFEKAHDGSDASVMSCYACSRRLASLRFGTKPGGFAPLGFIPHFAPSSLFATARRFFIVTPRLLTTPGFPPTRDNHGRLRLPYMVIPRSGPSGLFATARRFFIVTPRLFATAGFPPIRDRHGGLRPPYAYPSLRSIQPAHDGSALRFFTLNLQTGLLTREGRGGTVCLALEENEC